MGHVILLGDSVFDNSAYVGRGEPDVVRQLRGRLPAGWGATLAAVDGAVTGSVPRQLERIPPGATHLVVSVGGNDALRRQDVLEVRARSVAEGLLALAEALDGFARGLERDRRAVAAAIATPWSTSPAEGQITRLKAIKRSMYGRAGFHLLRQRILMAA